MNELEELIESLDFKDNRYFYHITSKGYGEKIIEEGLAMENFELESTTIEIPVEMIDDPTSYCKGEYSDLLVKRQEMVIIGCEKGEEEYLVEKSDFPKWIGGQKLDYVISSEYILGFIDLETLRVTYNQEYQYGGRHV